LDPDFPGWQVVKALKYFVCLLGCRHVIDAEASVDEAEIVMGEEEVSKERITTQLKSAVKALQAAHVRYHANVIHRYVDHTRCLAVTPICYYITVKS